MPARYESPASVLAGNIPSYWAAAACNAGDASLVPVFFPEHGKGAAAYRQARRICASCPVTAECLDVAMRQEEAGGGRHGIVGGLTPAERHELARGRR